MLDDAMTDASTPQPRCMWCSAALPSDSETTCPSCGATLVGEGDNNVPGVTAIDAAAIVRAGRETKPRSRNRIISWISGDYPEEDEHAPEGSLTPPPPDVQREMLRLELEAQVANLQAEASALAAEQAVEAVEAGASPESAAADAAAAVAAVTEATAGVVEVANAAVDAPVVTEEPAPESAAGEEAAPAAEATPATEPAPAAADGAVSSEADPAT
jgi:hypothetical protein